MKQWPHNDQSKEMFEGFGEASSLFSARKQPTTLFRFGKLHRTVKLKKLDCKKQTAQKHSNLREFWSWTANNQTVLNHSNLRAFSFWGWVWAECRAGSLNAHAPTLLGSVSSRYAFQNPPAVGIDLPEGNMSSMFHRHLLQHVLQDHLR
jgi:hypothetical protein